MSAHSLDAERPRFDQLPVLPGLGLRHAWDLPGIGDLGSISLLTHERLLAALTSARQGRTFNVTVPIGSLDPPLYAREMGAHTVFRQDRNYWDDRLDGFFLQSTTHWDGLRHVQAREYGHFGGRTDSDLIRAGSGPLGIEHWARHGIVGRGVLLDIAGHLSSTADGCDPFVSAPVFATQLDETAANQGVQLRVGDVLCLRFGWMGRYLSADLATRRTAAADMAYLGLATDEAMARWVWDHGLAAVVADNPSVEFSPGDPAMGSLHRRLIPLLGMALGELFDFDALAEDCRRDGRWEFLFVSVPLNLPGGVGSPANALAIK